MFELNQEVKYESLFNGTLGGQKIIKKRLNENMIKHEQFTSAQDMSPLSHHCTGLLIKDIIIIKLSSKWRRVKVFQNRQSSTNLTLEGCEIQRHICCLAL